MNEEENDFELECETIKKERTTYTGGHIKGVNIYKFYDYLSVIFLCLGFISLILTFFTEVTLLQATCFFVIHYAIAPTDADRAENVIKGITEDLGHIRASLAVIRRKKVA